MTNRLSADENDNWRVKRNPLPSLQSDESQSTQHNGTTYYDRNHRYTNNGYRTGYNYDRSSTYNSDYHGHDQHSNSNNPHNSNSSCYNNSYNNRSYNNDSHKNNNSKQHYNKGTTFFTSMEDVKPPPGSRARLRPVLNLNSSTGDASNDWRPAATQKLLTPSIPKSFKARASYCHPEDRNSNNRKEFFTPYQSPSEIETKIKDGLYFQGIMRLTKNRDDTYVTTDDLTDDIYIGGARARNRSLQGDFVTVRLLNNVEEIWNTKKERDARKKKDRKMLRLAKSGETDVSSKNDHDNENKEDEDENKENDENNEEQDSYTPAYCGEVVGITLRPPDATYSGYISIHKRSNHDGTTSDSNFTPSKLHFAWFRPTDKRVPFLILKNEDIPKDLIENEEYYTTHLFSASIRRWQITDTCPLGKIEKELGPVGDLLVEREAIISNNNVIASNFSDLAMKNLPELPWCIPEKEYQVRRDLRKKCVFSIDPSTAKDLDDALHIEKLDDGLFEVGVHIADVSYFLRKGSALDNEARSRGTSTYLVDGVIPMLPPTLCEELCSLNPGVDRLAFSVIWKMGADGVPIDTWFGKTIIRSCSKLAYEDAQCVLEGGLIPPNVAIYGHYNHDKVANDILLLNSIALNKRERRYAEGSLSLNSVKLNFDLDEYGEPISVHQFQQKEANRLIEEFMLSANISVAREITESFPDEALLRRHEEPLERRLQKFLKLTDTLGLDFYGYSAGDLQKSFDKITHNSVKDVLLVLAIRCMQRAKYFCAGVADISKYGHYALNEPLYTHFTSPIRRYADVIVHRMLECAIEKKANCGYEKKAVQKITFDCNSKKEGSRSAQDGSINIYLARYLFNLEMSSGRPLYTQGVVISVEKEVFEVYVPKFGLEKKFFLEALPTEGFQFDKCTHALDILWKQGVPVSMHNEEQICARERVRKDDYNDDEVEDKDVEEEDDGEFVDDFDRLNISEDRIRKNDSELVPPIILDASTGLQKLKMFSSVDIRIQVNMTLSPPIVNIYPVNPFSGEQVDQYIQ